jgi:putative ABC transport system permease protein
VSVPVARRNLLAEKGRLAISVAGVTLAVLLVLIVLALYRGFARSGQTFRELPGQLWVVQQGTSDPFHSVSIVQRSELDAVALVEGVDAVVPVLARTMEFRVNGSVESARVTALGVPPHVALPQRAQERYLPEPGALIIDETFSRTSGLHRGDTADFGSAVLTVERIEPASGEALTPFVFVNYRDAEQIFGRPGLATYGMVILGDTARPTDAAAAIEGAVPAIDVYSSEEFATSIRKELDESFIPIISVLVAIGFVVGAAIVGLTIYTATIERSREFGVMKAVGGSGGFLYRIVLAQSAILTGGGFALGLLGTWLVSWLAREAAPAFITVFAARDVAAVLAGTAAMALVASFLPAHRVSSIDPASVFRA